MGHESAVRRVLLALFAVSGFSGLIYESVWSHYLKLMLGHAAHAQTLVLAIFMGGMAAGAWFASRRSERWGRPLLAYALIEGMVGVIAIVFHRTFTLALDGLFERVLPALDGAAFGALVKWGTAALLILPQSVLLGMTFPLMSAAIIRICPERQGATLGLLYFSNSIGAAAGVLASGFLLIPWSGLPGTITIAGALNVLLALAVWWMQRDLKAHDAEPDRSAETAAGGSLQAMLLVAALLTGAASFFYEIGWIRMLSLVLGTTTQAFELMLSAFILGLALGGLWIRRRIDGSGSPLRLVGHVQVLMGAFALLTLPLYGEMFGFMGFLIDHLDKTDSGFAWFNLGSHAIALAVMLPATVMAGMTLPLFTFALLGRGFGERSIGRVYAANTVGAIFGVLAGVHWVMPAVGTKGLIVTGAAIDAVLGLALLGAVRARCKRWELPAVAATAGVVIAAVVFGVRIDPHRTASGVYRHGRSELPQGSEIVYHRDGKTATIDLIREPNGTMTIATNGKPDARIAVSGGEPAADEVTMVLLAAVPLALHPEARTVANIGMGSGMTTHTLLGARTLERVDTIEIEAAMVEAARGFGASVERAFADPRSHVHIEDAKTFFAARNATYDLIISEPSNPWVSGVASLFSSEFYRHVARHLAPEGLLVQWLQLYETDLDLVASIFGALSSGFSDYTVFNTDNANILIVASNGGDLSRLDNWVFRDPLLRQDLARVGIRGGADLELRRIGSRTLLGPAVALRGAPANSDYHPFVSVRAPRARYLGSDAADLTRLHLAPVPVAEMLDPHVGPRLLPVTMSPYFAPAKMPRLARQLVEALAAPATPAADNEDVARVVQGLSRPCDGPDGEEVELLARWTWVAAATNPHLSGVPIDRMWNDLRELACAGRLTPRAEEWLRLHKAVGRRDAWTMLAAAERLLDDFEAGVDRPQLDYVLTAGLTGARAAGDGAAFDRLRERFVRHYPADADPPFYLQVLLAPS